MINSDLICRVGDGIYKGVFNLNTKGNAVVRQAKKAILNDAIASENLRNANTLKDAFECAIKSFQKAAELAKQVKNKEFLDIINRYLRMNGFEKVNSKEFYKLYIMGSKIAPGTKINVSSLDVLDKMAFDMPLEKAVEKGNGNNRTKLLIHQVIDQIAFNMPLRVAKNHGSRVK